MGWSGGLLVLPGSRPGARELVVTGPAGAPVRAPYPVVPRTSQPVYDPLDRVVLLPDGR